jgi:hypothetical protein
MILAGVALQPDHRNSRLFFAEVERVVILYCGADAA